MDSFILKLVGLIVLHFILWVSGYYRFVWEGVNGPNKSWYFFFFVPGPVVITGYWFVFTSFIDGIFAGLAR